MQIRERADRREIFNRLELLLGSRAQQVALQVTELVRAGENAQALQVLKNFDAEIGGVGLHTMKPSRKLPGPYRSISYVFMALRNSDAEDRSRNIIEFACQNIESVLKKMVRLGFFEQMRSDFIPLGRLLEKAKRKLTVSLYSNLMWLNGEIYIFAKHECDFSDRDEPEPEHFFELDEAIAVYLIARKLVVELSKLIAAETVQSWLTEV
jgi:hypothetical protein